MTQHEELDRFLAQYQAIYDNTIGMTLRETADYLHKQVKYLEPLGQYVGAILEGGTMLTWKSWHSDGRPGTVMVMESKDEAWAVLDEEGRVHTFDLMELCKSCRVVE